MQVINEQDFLDCQPVRLHNFIKIFTDPTWSQPANCSNSKLYSSGNLGWLAGVTGFSFLGQSWGFFHGSVLCFSATEDQQFLSNFWLQCWETQLAAIRVLQGLWNLKPSLRERRETLKHPKHLSYSCWAVCQHLSKTKSMRTVFVSTLYLWLYIFSQRAFEVLQATDHQVLVRHCTGKRTIHPTMNG